MPTTSVDEDDYYFYIPSANDIDAGVTVDIIAHVYPAWVSFNESEGMLFGTPTNNQVGTFSIVMLASSELDIIIKVIH